MEQHRPFRPVISVQSCLAPAGRLLVLLCYLGVVFAHGLQHQITRRSSAPAQLTTLAAGNDLAAPTPYNGDEDGPCEICWGLAYVAQLFPVAFAGVLLAIGYHLAHSYSAWSYQNPLLLFCPHAASPRAPPHTD